MTLIQITGSIPISEEIKLAIFLLSGISTGLGSPFVVNFIGGSLPVVVGLIISSSLIVPFLLSTFVFVFFNDNFTIPIYDMIFLLSVALFSPLIISQLLKKFAVKAANQYKHKIVSYLRMV